MSSSTLKCPQKHSPYCMFLAISIKLRSCLIIWLKKQQYMAVVLEGLTRLQTKSAFCCCIFRHTRHTIGDWSSKFGGTEHVPPVGCFSRRRTRGAECYQWQWQWTMRDSLLPIMIMISCMALQVAPCLLHPRVGGWMKSYFMSSFCKISHPQGLSYCCTMAMPDICQSNCLKR